MLDGLDHRSRVSTVSTTGSGLDGLDHRSRVSTGSTTGSGLDGLDHRYELDKPPVRRPG